MRAPQQPTVPLSIRQGVQRNRTATTAIAELPLDTRPAAEPPATPEAPATAAPPVPVAQPAPRPRRARKPAAARPAAAPAKAVKSRPVRARAAKPEPQRQPKTRRAKKPAARAVAPAPRPGKSKPPVAHAAQQMAASAIRVIDDGWQRVLADEDPEGAHTLRIGLRRMRVVLHIFRRDIRASDLSDLPEVLAETARDVGRLRDLDVLIGDIVAPLFAAEPVTGAQVLLDTLEAERIAARAGVRSNLRNTEARALERTLAKLPGQLAQRVAKRSEARSMRKFARRDLRKRWRKISMQAANIDTLSAEDLHEVRKSIKNLRYAFADFASHWDPKTGAGFERRLKRLQNAFGYLNDVTVARQLEARVSRDPARAETNCAIGYVLGWHTERAIRARHSIAEQWQKLAATKLVRDFAD